MKKTVQKIPNKAKKAALAAEFSERLRSLYPDAECALKWHGEPWKLMILGRLSAQCTDARVNIVGEELFRKFPTAESIASAPIEELEEIIRPCGLYKVKSQNVKDEMIMLTEDYGGVMPSDMDELLKFPGVGRKIANLLRGDIFELPAIVADTHCIRICGRFGMYPESVSDPNVCERVMTELLPPDETSDFCHRIVLFGREYCSARAPRCSECPMADICPHKSKKKT